MHKEQDLDEETLTKHNRRATRLSKFVYWLLLVCIGTLVALVAKVVLFAPPAAVFLRTELLTPVVHAGGPNSAVRLRTWIDSPIDPKCLVSTQYFITFSNGVSLKLPGRKAWTQGDLKVAIYETDIPRFSPVGKATYRVTDVYSCALQVQRVNSPVGNIEILPPVPSNGPTQD